MEVNGAEAITLWSDNVATRCMPGEARDGRNVALIEFIGVLDRPKKSLLLSTKHA